MHSILKYLKDMKKKTKINNLVLKRRCKVNVNFVCRIQMFPSRFQSNLTFVVYCNFWDLQSGLKCDLKFCLPQIENIQFVDGPRISSPFDGDQDFIWTSDATEEK